MATEKETIDGCEKKEEDATLIEVDEKGVKEDPEEVVEKADGPGGNEEAEEKEVEEEDVKEDREDEEVREEHEEGERDAEEAEVEGKGEDVDEDDDGKKIDGEENEKKSEISKKRTRKQRKGEIGELESPRTPSERPTRERKMVERFMVGETPKASASKTLSIEKVSRLLFVFSCWYGITARTFHNL